MFNRTPTIDRALRGFAKALKDFEAAAKHHDERAMHHDYLAQFHDMEMRGHTEDGVRAAKIAEQIKDAIDAAS